MFARELKQYQQDLFYEGYQDVIQELNDLLHAYPPPFIYVNDPITPRISASLIRSTLDKEHSTQDTRLYSASVDASICFTQRLFYDTVVNSLTSWSPDWADGCNNWAGPSDTQGNRDSGSLDGFLSTLQSFFSTLGAPDMGSGQITATDTQETRLIIFIEHAERLKETMPDLMVPITRLAELSRLDVTVIMHSNVHWELIRPPMGASLDPYHISVPPISREATLARLSATYPPSPLPSRRTGLDPNTYHPNLKPLHVLYVSTLYAVCSPFTKDLDELAYIAAARWPGFVQPVLDEHKQRVAALRLQHQHHIASEETVDENALDLDEIENITQDTPNIEEPALECPDEHTRMRLLKLFRNSIQHALEHLYPRRTSALAWAHANAPPADLLARPPHAMPPVAGRLPADAARDAPLHALPRMAKCVLVAAFLASTNPARTDVRMFGRGPDERKKRKRGGPRKSTAKSTALKIPQRLIGPMPFALDRMFAILGALLEDNDADNRPPAPEYEISGEYTEMEISRVAVYAQVMELTSMHLLHRTSPADRFDMSPVFKCGISYDAALSLARDVGIALNDLMWEPV